jgi:hypothetical protein
VFAYHVSSDPYHPESAEWATLVRRERVRAGDILSNLAVSRVSGDVRTIDGSPDRWEVIAVEPTEDDGRPAVVKRKLASAAVWDGKLVLRLAK